MGTSLEEWLGERSTPNIRCRKEDEREKDAHGRNRGVVDLRSYGVLNQEPDKERDMSETLE